MLSYRLGSVNGLRCGFKPVISYSRPIADLSLFQHLLEKKTKKKTYNDSLYPDHIDFEQNEKSKEVHPKWKAWTREPYVQMSSASENHYRSVADRSSLEINKW